MKSAFAGQYHAGIAMLRQAVERCPSNLWTAGDPRRPFWRVAYHAIFYTHLYLMPTESDFLPSAIHREDLASLWQSRKKASQVAPCTQAEILGYIDDVTARLDEYLAAIDFEAPKCGFSWYKVSKFEHQLVNIRHLQGHVGQLSELLMAAGIDVDWVGSGRPKKAPTKANASSGVPLPKLSAPAMRALTNAGVDTLDAVAKRTRGEIAVLHGMGPNALDKLASALTIAGLSFADEPLR